jgi:hypothetical protein
LSVNACWLVRSEHDASADGIVGFVASPVIVTEIGTSIAAASMIASQPRSEMLRTAMLMSIAKDAERVVVAIRTTPLE